MVPWYRDGLLVCELSLVNEAESVNGPLMRISEFEMAIHGMSVILFDIGDWKEAHLVVLVMRYRTSVVVGASVCACCAARAAPKSAMRRRHFILEYGRYGRSRESNGRHRQMIRMQEKKRMKREADGDWALPGAFILFTRPLSARG